jgi:uncharacterized protein
MNSLLKLITPLAITISTQAFAAPPQTDAIEKQKITKKGVVIQNYKPAVTKPTAANDSEPNYANYAPLAQAVLRGDLNQIDTLLNAGTQIQTLGNNAESLLELAAFKAEPAIVQRLIAAGADVTAMSSKNESIVALYIFRQAPNDKPSAREQSIQLLLKKGAVANVKTADGQPLVGLATHIGAADILAALLDAGADANAVDTQMQTALFSAARQGNEALTDLLLAKGAQVNFVSAPRPVFGSDTPLMQAIQGRNETLALKLLGLSSDEIIAQRRGQASNQQIDQDNALTLAIKYRKQKVFEQLLAKGVPVNADTDDERISPLVLAIRSRDANMFNQVIERGANVNQLYAQKRTALFLVAPYCVNANVFETLAEKGADLHATDDKGDTAFCAIKRLDKNHCNIKTISGLMAKTAKGVPKACG